MKKVGAKMFKVGISNIRLLGWVQPTEALYLFSRITGLSLSTVINWAVTSCTNSGTAERETLGETDYQAGCSFSRATSAEVCLCWKCDLHDNWALSAILLLLRLSERKKPLEEESGQEGWEKENLLKQQESLTLPPATLSFCITESDASI